MSRKHPESSRRQFITTAATAVAAATIVPRHVLGGPGFVAPSDKVNVAIIGAGGQGRTNVRSLLQENDCQVIAIADPCEEWDISRFYYGGKAGRGPVKAEIEQAYAAKTPNFACAVYEDFRVMLEKEKAVDAVLIATPDHSHAYISIFAMKAGKHVYCEKPLTHDIAEARIVARVARETGVATQMGNYGRSSEGHRQTAEWIWDGAIGAVREVHSWGGSQPFAKGRAVRRARPTCPRASTGICGWGPASSGPITRRMRRSAGAATGPSGAGRCRTSRSTTSTQPLTRSSWTLPRPWKPRPTAAWTAEVCSAGMLVTWRYAARGTRGPVTVHWYDGGLRPPTPLGIDPEDPRQRLGEGGSGILFIGDKGIITCAGWSGMPRLLPLERHRDYERPAKTLPRVEGHHADWLQACKGGKPASSNFDYGARLCEFIMLGNVALRAQKLLKWDGPNMKATNAPEADQYLKRHLPSGMGTSRLKLERLLEGLPRA